MSSASSLNARGCYFLLLLKLLLKLHLVSDFAKNSFHGISASHPNGWKIEGQDSLSCNDCHITTKRATKEDQRPTSCATVTHTWQIRLQHTHTHTQTRTHTHTHAGTERMLLQFYANGYLLLALLHEKWNDNDDNLHQEKTRSVSKIRKRFSILVNR